MLETQEYLKGKLDIKEKNVYSLKTLIKGNIRFFFDVEFSLL